MRAIVTPVERAERKPRGGVPRALAQLGRRWYPAGLWEGPPSRRWVTLTIDDGPDPEITPRLLQALRAAGATATFFVEGRRAAAEETLLRRIHAEGHEVGNHTWSHLPLGYGTCASPRRELTRTEALLSRVCPGSPRLFRPPFGAVGLGARAALAAEGLTPVYWSVVPGDWNPLTPEELRRRVLSEVHPGAVIVLHGGQAAHSGTAEALPALIEELRADGYEIVPAARMLAECGFRVERRSERLTDA
ncbi:MAG: polysaccharide deacetylase family protein [Armatimonadota bacterium]